MRVLLVKDDTLQWRTLSDLLNREGYKVDVCSTAEEAISRLQGEQFPICVLRDLEEGRLKQANYFTRTASGRLDSVRESSPLGAFAHAEKSGSLGGVGEMVGRGHPAATQHTLQSLSQAEVRIRLQVGLLDWVQRAVIATDVPGHVIQWNRFSEALYGWTAEEAYGRNVFDLVVAEDQSVDSEEIMCDVRGGQVRHCEFVVQHRHGHRFPAELTASPILDASGQLIGLINEFTDITERKKHEVALTKSEEQKRAIFNSALDAIITIDQEGRIVELNPAAYKMFELPPCAAVGRRLSDLIIPPRFREAHRRGLARYLESGQSELLGRRVEMTGWRADGTEFPVELTVTRIDTDGPPMFTGHVRDISKEKQADLALRESEERFRQLAENIDAVFWMRSADGAEQLYVSPRFESLWGRSLNTPRENPDGFVEAVLPIDRPLVDQAYAELRLGAPQKYDLEYRIERPDGQVRWIHDRAFAIRDKNGQLVRIAGLAQDVTDRKQTEEALQASERAYRLIVEASGEAIIGLTMEAIVTTWNPAAERMFGYRADEVVGESIARLVPRERRAEPEQVFSQIRAGQAVVEFQCQRLTKDGRLRDVVINAQPIVDESGNITGASGVVRDVTDYKVAQEHLRRLEAELAHVARVITMGEMASALAHELVQPLSAAANYVGGCIHLIEAKRARPADLLEPLRRIEAQVERTGEIIHGMSSFSSKATPKKRFIELNELVRDVDERLLPKGPGELVKRRLDLCPGLPRAFADPTQIKQVLVNLVCNAAQATRESRESQKEVVIETSTIEGELIVRVIDDGIGIAAEHLHQVFEPYFTTKPDGMGMGLAICRTIIRNHHGSIWGELNAEGGTRICFTLPSTEKTTDESEPDDAAQLEQFTTSRSETRDA